MAERYEQYLSEGMSETEAITKVCSLLRIGMVVSSKLYAGIPFRRAPPTVLPRPTADVRLCVPFPTRAFTKLIACRRVQ